MSVLGTDLAAALGVGLYGAAAAATPRWRRLAAPVGGVAAGIVLWTAGPAPFLTVVGVTGLALAQLAPPGGHVLMIGGAGFALLAISVDGAAGLPSGLLTVALVAGLGWAWPRLTLTMSWWAGAAVLTGSVLGVWATVPDTEEITLAALAVLPVLLALSAWGNRLVPPSVWALVAVLAWAAMQGGRGRPGSVVGAFTCLGLVVALAAVLGSRRPGALALATLVVVNGGAVLLASRVVGLESSATTAALLAVPVAIGAVGLELLVFGVAGRLDR